MTYGKYIAWKIRSDYLSFLLVAAASLFRSTKLRLTCTSLAICGAKTFMRFITGVVCFFIDGYFV